MTLQDITKKTLKDLKPDQLSKGDLVVWTDEIDGPYYLAIVTKVSEEITILCVDHKTSHFIGRSYHYLKTSPVLKSAKIVIKQYQQTIQQNYDI